MTPWTVACQAPLSMGFSRQEFWSGLPLPSPGDLPDPGIEPGSPTLQADAFPSEPPGKPCLGETLPAGLASGGSELSEVGCAARLSHAPYRHLFPALLLLPHCPWGPFLLSGSTVEQLPYFSHTSFAWSSNFISRMSLTNDIMMLESPILESLQRRLSS